MNVLVTGATGVLGRRVVPLLVGAGHSVTAAVRSPEKAAGVRAAGATPLVLNLFDAIQVRDAVAEQDAICNLATSIPPLKVALKKAAWRTNDAIRTTASKILVNAALDSGVDCFIQESIAFVYKEGGEEWITEDWPVEYAPNTASSAVAEAETMRFAENGGGEGIVLRFGGFYAADASHTIDMKKMVDKGLAPLFPPPGAYSSFIHVDDAARAVVAALEARTGIYNVAEDEPATRVAIISAMTRAQGVKRQPRFVPPWMMLFLGRTAKTLSRSQRISSRKFKGATGWSPQHRTFKDEWPDVARLIR